MEINSPQEELVRMEAGAKTLPTKKIGAKKIALTSAQKSFLIGYVDDICYAEDAHLKTASSEKFVANVVRKDFDGSIPKKDIRVANHLNAMGFFEFFEIHADIAGGACLHLSFSALGARAIHECMQVA